MIRVEEVQLDDITLPDHGIGMVIMQPFVELNDHEPYRWRDDKKSKQIERIVRTFEIAKQADHGCEKTHFTIFPEYAIPGLEGVQKIQEILRSDSWKDGTIVIGGIDGLTKGEYSTLCSEDNTEVYLENTIDRVRDDQWVNCCITWVKKTNGSLKRWVQPKLTPSWPEKNITHSQMFAGRSVYIFSGKFENQTEFRFLSLICFDWIGPIGPNYGIWAVLSEIDNCWRNTRREMNLVFLLQHNQKPNHRNFLENARNYFERRREFPFINRNEGIILFANTAGGSIPGKYQNYGYSSLISSPVAPYDNKGCPPTFALITQKLRGTDSLGRCREALFREMGACIHSLKFRLPPFINLSPADRCLPIDEAIVHAIDDGIDDPRTPGGPVPASVKWVNDQLNDIEPLLSPYPTHPLKEEVVNIHREVSDEIIKESGNFLCRYVEMALCEYNKWIEVADIKIHNVDHWDGNEQDGLKTVVYSLSIMKVCNPLEVRGSPAHGTIKIQDKVVDIIVISGKTHEKCFEYAKNQYPGSGQRFVVVVTNDGKSSWPKRARKSSILDVEYDSSRGPHIADPSSGFIHCGYINLVDSCIHSMNLEELMGRIKEVIGM